MEILNQKTLKVLQSLNAIHNSVIVSYPVTCIRESKSIQAYLNLEKLGQTEAFEEFGIYDLTSFLSAVSLISEPSIQKNDNTIIIRNSNSAVSYRTSNIELLEEENRGDSPPDSRMSADEKPSRIRAAASRESRHRPPKRLRFLHCPHKRKTPKGIRTKQRAFLKSDFRKSRSRINPRSGPKGRPEVSVQTRCSSAA